MTSKYVPPPMKQATKKLKKKELNDLREQIKQSAEDPGTHFQQSNKTSVTTYKTENQNRHSKDNREILRQLEIKNYAGLKPSEKNVDMKKMNFEAFKKDSKNTILKDARYHNAKNRSVLDTIEEQDHHEFGTFDPAEKADKKNHQSRNNQHDLINEVPQFDPNINGLKSFNLESALLNK